MHLFALLRISGNGLTQYESILLRSPVLCGFAKEFYFYNQLVDESKSRVKNQTIETASHAVRIAHKLSNVHYLMADKINLAIEHPHLPRHISALAHIDKLDFSSSVPTKLTQLARILVSFKNLSALYLVVPIISDPDSLPLPTPYYATKSSLKKLYLVIQSGGHLLVDWLVQAKTFTTFLETLDVRFEHQIPQPEIVLVMRGVQHLLDGCAKSLKEWNFHGNIQVDDFSDIPQSEVVLIFPYPNANVLFSISSVTSLSIDVASQSI